MKRTYTLEEARGIAEGLEIDFAKSGFDLPQFQAGLNVEAEHGAVDPATNVTNDDPVTTGKIALAHLNEMPDYYTRLQTMEAAGINKSQPQRSRRRGLATVFFVGLALVAMGAAFAVCFRNTRRNSA
jgi:hypothetical protein